MIRDKKSFLKQIATMTELADNTIAFVFSENPDIDITSKEKYFDNMVSHYKRFKLRRPDITKYEIEENDNLIENWRNKDLRIKNVKLKSIRGYPESNVPYIINFADANNEPQSMIILGGNATGKSSIYDSIEMCYCNSIGEALLRSYEDSDGNKESFMPFLEHFNNGIKNIYCKVETKTDIFDIQNKENIPQSVRRVINPDTHFISDYDIYSNGQLSFDKNSESSFHNTIAQSLGLSDLLQFEKNLKLFSFYRRQVESRNILALQKSIDNEQGIVENTRAAIEERKVRLNKLSENEISNSDDDNLKNLRKKINELIISDVAYSYDSNELLNSYNNFSAAYEEFVSRGLNKSSYNELQFLNLGLDLLKEHDNCPLCNSSTLPKPEIESYVRYQISKAYEFNESLQKLNRVFEIQIEVLKVFWNGITSLSNLINNEILAIGSNVELNELLVLDNSFINKMSDLLNQDFFITFSKLDENSNYLNDKYKFLYELIIYNRDFVNSDIINFINETVNFIQKRLGLIRLIESRFNDDLREKTASEQIIILKKEINDFENQSIEIKGNIEREKVKINEFIETQRLFAEIKTETTSYLKVFHNKLNEIVSEVFNPIKQVVQNILQNYFEVDDRDVAILIEKIAEDIDLETGEILSEIITAKIISKSGKFLPQSVNKYLNTFHYRLFSTMVGVSIAIASRINIGINLPLLMDDIFYASDFENRVTIEKFLVEIFKAFNTYTPSEPLQLILFTHDQLIFESAIKIILTLGSKNIAFGKLLPFKEATMEGEYLNLLYRFPEYLPNTILNNLLTAI
jgi:hypothetical protein